MPPTEANDPNSSRNGLNSPDFELPPFENSPKVIQMGLYTWKLEPFKEGFIRHIILNCTECSYLVKSKKSSIHSTNLKSHWVHKHEGLLRILWDQANSSDLPREQTFLSSNILNSVDTSTPVIDSFFSRTSRTSVSSVSRTNAAMAPRVATYAPFDPNVYKTVLFDYLMSNNLPFSHVDSPALKALLDYAKRCLTSLPKFTRISMREDLEFLFNKEFEFLKRHLAAQKGRFALTLDEWKSGNRFDFLAITLHFHNERFILEKYVIGFEVLNGETSYTGNVIYDNLVRVLSDYEIKDRIISITRDNAGPMNTMIETFKEDFEDIDAGLEFSGDLRCVGHVLNLVTKAFLCYTFFKPNDTVVFRESVQSVKNHHPELEDLFSRMENVPNIVNSIITSTRQNHFLKNSFLRMVKERKAREGKKTGPQVLLQSNDTRWLSVFKMLERFVFFRDQITELLEEVASQSNSKRRKLKVVSLKIDHSTWDYLSTIVDILKIFVEATKLLQGDTYETSNMTIPYVCGVLKALEKWEAEEIAQTNPLIALGLQEARKKLLQYYPVHSDDIEPIKDLYVATVLDPHMKLGIFQDLGLPTSVVHAIEDYFYEVFRRYKRELAAEESSNPKRRAPNDVGRQSLPASGRMSDLFYTEQDAAGEDDENEIRKYLAELRSPRSLSIRAFYEAEKNSFPTIYRMGRDFLSMMAMSAPSESLFSRVKNIVTDKRNQLDPSTIRLLAILKARGILRDENMIIADASDVVQVDRENDQDGVVVADTSEDQVSGEVSEIECLVISSEDEEEI